MTPVHILIMDTYAGSCKFTAPLDAKDLTSIGWYCDNATQEANFQVGLYAHDAEGAR